MNVHTPTILLADSYSISSDGFASNQAKIASVYNFTNRYGAKKGFPEVARDNRMVFFGINHYIDRYLTRRVTLDDIKESERFLADAHSFGGPLYFPKELWLRVVNEYGGYLPIKITALEEGRTFFPNEPVIVVKAEDGFGELAAHIEARLVGTVSIGSAVATLCRHWRERILTEVHKDLNRTLEDVDSDNIAHWQVHNFGCRACSSEEESILTGMAHLLSFNGTDNTDAAYHAIKGGAVRPVGTSILALAHRNVLGHEYETSAFKAIAAADKGKMKIVSCVADTYNFKKAVASLIRLAKEDLETCYVIRPDSDSAFNTISEIYNQAVAAEFYEERAGFKIPKVRFIYGDSITPGKQLECMRELRDNRILPTLWGIWGCGGSIVNSCTRDTLSSAYKLAAINASAQFGSALNPTVKLSEVETKMSVPYETMLVDTFPRVQRANGAENRIDRIYYDKGKFYPTNFALARKNALEDFDRLKCMVIPFSENGDFGSKREDVLSTDITDQQNYIYARYRS